VTIEQANGRPRSSNPHSLHGTQELGASVADSIEIVSGSILVRRRTHARRPDPALLSVESRPNFSKLSKLARNNSAESSLSKGAFRTKRRAVGLATKSTSLEALAAEECGDYQPEGQPVEDGRGVDLTSRPFLFRVILRRIDEASELAIVPQKLLQLG
jgi:hypothetical protein